MKSYIEFLNEGFMFEKKIKKHILITTAVALTPQTEYKQLTTELAQILFDKYSTNKDYIKKEDEEEIAQLGNDRPILYMTSNNDDYWHLGLKNLDCVYGSVIPWDKIIFSKLFQYRDWLPKTVFTLEDALKLKFPIIAKIKSGHSGLGVKKFNNAEELQKFKQPFDITLSKIKKITANFELYSECVEFKNEYRAFVLNGKIFYVSDRIGVDGDKSTVKGKDYQSSVNFLYIPQDYQKIPKDITRQLEEICSTIQEDVNLSYFALDWCVDNQGKVWVFEVNKQPGLNADELYYNYKAMYQDFYKKDIDLEIEDYILRNYVHKIFRMYYEGKEDLWAKSKWAIDYKKFM
jgi:glutathione synthase/RimK-type ligase-like ATP-grasp enzyme